MKQSTLALPQSSPLNGLVGLARTIALPHEYAPTRFPSFPALERTAVLGFSVPTTASVSTTTDTKFLLARQAAFPCWADQVMSSGEIYGFPVDYTTPQTASSAPDPGFIEMPLSYYNSGSGNRAATGLVPGVSGVSSTRVTYPLLGADSGCTCSDYFVFVPTSAFVYVSLGQVNTIETGLNITMEKWNSPGQVTPAPGLVVTIAIGAQGAMTSTTITGPGWFRPSFIHSRIPMTAVSTQISVTIVPTNAGTATVVTGSSRGIVNLTVPNVGDAQFLPLVYPTEFVNSKLPWFATRTNAASLLLTNVTSALNKAGTVLAGRISPNVMDPFGVTKPYINTLHPAEKAYLPLETGMYTYCPPSTDMQGFWDYTSVSRDVQQTFATPVYRLDNDSMVNVAFLTSPSVVEAIAVTVDWHIEFRTSSALFNIGMSTMPIETLHQAQLVLTEHGFFFENVNHKVILGKLTALARKYVPRMVSAANPLAGALLKQGIKYFSSKPNKTIRPTSLQKALPPFQKSSIPKNGKGGRRPPKKKGGLQMYLESNGRR